MSRKKQATTIAISAPRSSLGISDSVFTSNPCRSSVGAKSMGNIESAVKLDLSPDVEIHAMRRPVAPLGWLVADLSHASEGAAPTGVVRPTNSSPMSSKFAGTWANAVSTMRSVGLLFGDRG